MTSERYESGLRMNKIIRQPANLSRLCIQLGAKTNGIRQSPGGKQWKVLHQSEGLYEKTGGKISQKLLTHVSSNIRSRHHLDP